MLMRAARLYAYHEPLRLEEVPVPDPRPDEVLIKVAAAGMCRSDFQLIEGYFPGPLPFPVIPGHEIAGRVVGLGSEAAEAGGLAEGDLAVVLPNWGDGTCRQCREGNEQLCAAGRMIGFGPPGGFAEYVAVPHRNVIAAGSSNGVSTDTAETLAPLTDAGLTPYRGMKKLKDAGALGAGRTVVVNGIGGLGSYAVQYARLLGGGATVVGFARSEDKLAVAKANGAHHTVNTRDKTAEQVGDELEGLTGRREADAILDCAGSAESLGLAAAILAREGALTSVGLMGERVELPLLPFVNGERSYFGSFWGNYTDLTEVLALAGDGLLKHNVTTVGFDDINDRLQALARGEIVGRAVITFD
ncbi:NAD(P)-dependent alcohol dehydrogenase [Mycobacterium sp. NPDC003449]